MATVTKRFFLTYIRLDHRDKAGRAYNLYRCDCGREKVIRADNVSDRCQSRTVSCGCYLATPHRDR